MVRSGYFVFTEEQRAGAKEELLRERGEGSKVSVAEVAKVLGQRWKQLTEAEREAYKARAKEEQAELDNEAAAAEQERQQAGGQPEGDDENEGGEGDAAAAAGAKEKKLSPADGLLPAATVRRIMQMDDELSRASQDAVVAVSIAADLLLGLLVQHAGNHARAQKRRTIQLKDFVQAVKEDRRFVQAGLRDVEKAVQSASEAGAAVRGAAKEAAQAAKEAAAAEAGAAAEGADGGSLAGDGAVGAGEEGDAGAENQDPAEPAAEAEVEEGAGGGKGPGRKRGPKGGEQQKLKKAALGLRKIDTFFGKAAA